MKVSSLAGAGGKPRRNSVYPRRRIAGESRVSLAAPEDDLIFSNLGILGAGLLTCWTVTKILAISGFDATTARQVVVEQGTSSVVLGSLINTWPFIFPVTAMAMIVRASARTPPRDSWQLIGLLFVASIFISPVGFYVVVVLALVLSIFIRLGTRVKSKDEALPETDGGHPGRLNFLIVFILVLLFAGNATDSVGWLPAERLEFTAESRLTAVTGFVLNDSNDSLQILTEDDKTILSVPSSSLRSRVLCVLPDDSVASVGRPWGVDLMSPAFAIVRNSNKHPHPSCGDVAKTK